MNFFQETTSLSVQQSSRLVNVNTEPKEVASNVQRDQKQSPPELLKTFDDLPSLPTDTPFISYPVTKSPGDCAHYQKGGWWYHMCAHSNLNGLWYRGAHYRSQYRDGVYWAEFHEGSYSLKKVAMMIKPA